MTHIPAEIVDIPKGTLSAGADADVVIFDPEVNYKVDPTKFQSKSRNSPFAGMKVSGKVKWTIVRGKVVFGE